MNSRRGRISRRAVLVGAAQAAVAGTVISRGGACVAADESLSRHTVLEPTQIHRLGCTRTFELARRHTPRAGGESSEVGRSYGD